MQKYKVKSFKAATSHNNVKLAILVAGILLLSAFNLVITSMGGGTATPGFLLGIAAIGGILLTAIGFIISFSRAKAGSAAGLGGLALLLIGIIVLSPSSGGSGPGYQGIILIGSFMIVSLGCGLVLRRELFAPFQKKPEPHRKTSIAVLTFGMLLTFIVTFFPYANLVGNALTAIILLISAVTMIPIIGFLIDFRYHIGATVLGLVAIIVASFGYIFLTGLLPIGSSNPSAIGIPDAVNLVAQMWAFVAYGMVLGMRVNKG
jgi:hypothetical protein